MLSDYQKMLYVWERFEMKLECEVCGKIFWEPEKLGAHMKKHDEPRSVTA
jgi:5-methylcytosine-specific restriction endonuclease McrA